jgi:hypothetical protein
MGAHRGGGYQISMPESRESLGDLLRELMTQSIELVKDEAALAMTELRENARLYSSAALITAVGVIF